MTKPKESDRPGKEPLDQLKKNDKKRKQEKRITNMKNILNSKTFAVIVAVLITVSATFGAYKFHEWSFNQGREMQRSLNAEIQTQAKVLSAQTPVEASK